MKKQIKKQIIKEINEKLRQAFANDKSHTQVLSENVGV